MPIYFLLTLVCLLTASIANADIICLKTVLKNGKIVQSVKTVAAGQTCPKSFKAIVNTATLTGPTGAQGLTGPAGAAGSMGATGATGGFTSTLPTGQTLRGAFGQYAVGENGAYKVSTHSFGAALSAAPTIHLVLSGAVPPAECPGTAAEPAALAGHLCLFEAVGIGRFNAGIFSPANGSATGNKFGFGYVFQSNANFSNSYGTWAVTAP